MGQGRRREREKGGVCGEGDPPRTRLRPAVTSTQTTPAAYARGREKPRASGRQSGSASGAWRTARRDGSTGLPGRGLGGGGGRTQGTRGPALSMWYRAASLPPPPARPGPQSWRRLFCGGTRALAPRRGPERTLNAEGPDPWPRPQGTDGPWAWLRVQAEQAGCPSHRWVSGPSPSLARSSGSQLGARESAGWAGGARRPEGLLRPACVGPGGSGDSGRPFVSIRASHRRPACLRPHGPGVSPAGWVPGRPGAHRARLPLKIPPQSTAHETQGARVRPPMP